MKFFKNDAFNKDLDSTSALVSYLTALSSVATQFHEQLTEIEQQSGELADQVDAVLNSGVLSNARAALVVQGVAPDDALKVTYAITKQLGIFRELLVTVDTRLTVPLTACDNARVAAKAAAGHAASMPELAAAARPKGGFDPTK